MKTLKFYSIALLLLVLISACDNQVSEIQNNDELDVKSEAFSESLFEDTESLTTIISLANDAALGGRSASIDDKLCDATVIDFLKNDSADADSIIVDFGSSGCIDRKGNIRKGTITIIFTGDRKISHTVIFNDFSLNGRLIEGTRTVNLSTLLPPTATITLEGGKITWPDNSFATREASHTRIYNINLQNPEAETIVIAQGGSATGTNRKGKTYSVEITSDIVFKRGCTELPIFIPVSGTKVIQVGTKTITIDYGDGSCDNKATITINGESKEIALTEE